MSRIKGYYIVILLILIASGAIAQETWEKPAGGIENAQVVIEKDKVISLRPVSRRFQAIDIPIPRVQPIEFKYQFAASEDSLPSLQVIVRPKTMRDQPLDKFYGLTGKLGYGNYNSPYVLLNLSNKRSDEYMFSTEFNHYSSGKGAVNDSPYYYTGLGVTGKYFVNNIILKSELNLTNQSYRLYGYDPAEYPSILDLDRLKQKLNNISFSIGLEDNNFNNDIDQALVMNINYLSNNVIAQEFLFGIGYALEWSLAKDWSLETKVKYRLASQNDLDQLKVKRSLVKFSPVLGYNLGNLELRAGVNGYYQNDTQDQGEGKIYVFPELGAIYNITNDHAVAAHLNGQVEDISLSHLYSENLYLDSAEVANNNINTINTGVSLEGRINQNFGYKLGFEYRYYKRLFFYTNNAVDTARFNVVYDNGGVSQNTFTAGLSYLVNDKLNFALDGSYNAYKTTDISEAWHKPRINASFTTNVYLLEKLNGRLTYFLMEGIKAESAAGMVKTLDVIHDLNLGLDFELTESAMLFVDFRNILGANYQIYNNYPVKGFQFIAGFGFRF